MPGIVSYRGAAAGPDTAGLRRLAALRSGVAAGILDPASVVGYDRGDPTHTFNTVVAAATRGAPRSAVNQIATDPPALPYSTVADGQVVPVPVTGTTAMLLRRAIAQGAL